MLSTAKQCQQYNTDTNSNNNTDCNTQYTRGDINTVTVNDTVTDSNSDNKNASKNNSRSIAKQKQAIVSNNTDKDNKSYDTGLEHDADLGKGDYKNGNDRSTTEVRIKNTDKEHDTDLEHDTNKDFDFDFGCGIKTTEYGEVISDAELQRVMERNKHKAEYGKATGDLQSVGEILS